MYIVDNIKSNKIIYLMNNIINTKLNFKHELWLSHLYPWQVSSTLYVSGDIDF